MWSGPQVPSGGWRSVSFIIGVEIAERVAYTGIGANLISYQTGPLGQSTATAAQNVNVWAGKSLVLTILGAFVADSYLGRYRTIVVASLLYILDLACLLSRPCFLLLALLTEKTAQSTPCSSRLQELLFFYLVAVGMDTSLAFRLLELISLVDKMQRNAEPKAHSSIGGILVYVQDNLSWDLDFRIPCILMVFALPIFHLELELSDIASPGMRKPVCENW
uniref:protein NRT1/ PTR FAMILY 5.16-like n=1 Tax=Fragaria vesca subsp. vesca TaxID=101020 RepID=UPI0005CAC4C8|nr:PREDICTED: protein NRT1/ PTR FAMILY 5.16-like [Fragaria vesca subsp. vesca]